ncbi:variant surface glycoprotein (VSG, atypical), putative [Trypanosoma brucei brucei TREU927]|uniref:Variant surface glycoprotein (VSG, atypical), putative n=1 Tax=Trypanosoma brucei brucei (strain 927/4 GUTat10.1) TaxID=185431 RepID=Q380W0_TRYB2|nr:variant surface glycoprotein [Trypanosoma brucei brucei TREU927]EAN80671.1 variant surface glycoprotein (VSG, atypical), putative [Trypanosoma brucei brucei TREU927]
MIQPNNIEQVLVLTLSMLTMQKAMAENEAENAIASLCHEAKYLHKVAEDFKSLLSTTDSDVSQAEKLTQIWQLKAAEATQLKEQNAYAALVLHGRLKIDKTKQARVNYKQTLSGVREGILQRISYLQGRTQAYTSFKVSKSTRDATTTKCKAKTTWAKHGDAQCDPTTLSNSPLERKTISAMAATKVKAATEAEIDIEMGNYDLELELSTALNSDSNNKCQTTTTQGTLEAITMVAKATAPHYGGKLLPTRKTDRPKQNCDAEEEKPPSKLPTADKLAALLCKAREAVPPPKIALESTTTETLFGDSDFLYIAAQLLTTEIPAGTQPEGTEADQIKQLIKSTYGDATTFGSRYTTGLYDKQTKYKKETQDSKGTLDSIATGTDLALVSSYFKGIALRLTAVQAGQEKQKNKTGQTDETCEKKGTGAECKDGCKLTGVVDNKKCVVDPDFVKKEVEGVKAENDGKTNTNTTGSNSVIIKKAPLVLAFFLR